MELDQFSKQLDYAGTQVTYHAVGQRSKYLTIILIHGTGGTTEKHFSAIFPMLGMHQRVLSIDLNTPDKLDLSLSDFSDQVKALIQYEIAADEALTVVGYSLGAVIAAQVAAQLQNQMKRLILSLVGSKQVAYSNFVIQFGNNYLQRNQKHCPILSITAYIATTICVNGLNNKCWIWHDL